MQYSLVQKRSVIWRAQTPGALEAKAGPVQMVESFIKEGLTLPGVLLRILTLPLEKPQDENGSMRMAQVNARVNSQSSRMQGHADSILHDETLYLIVA